MRVIAGEARGRRFRAPEVQAVRPTSDRVREAMFDVLSHLGGLREASVLDLFAGSGALGIESLSRGAAEVTFVDQDRVVAQTIRDNLVAVGLDRSGRASVVVDDAIAFCRKRMRLSEGTDIPAGDRTDVSGGIDVTFCDPPYTFANWPKLLGVIPGELLVLESARPIVLPSRFETYRVYKYGSTLVTVAQRREDEGVGSPDISDDHGGDGGQR